VKSSGHFSFLKEKRNRLARRPLQAKGIEKKASSSRLKGFSTISTLCGQTYAEEVYK
jgi:hypothetical protein